MLVDAELYTPSNATHAFLQSGKIGINTLGADIDFVYFDDGLRTTQHSTQELFSRAHSLIFNASFRQFWYLS